jgi:hypothetical protein
VQGASIAAAYLSKSMPLTFNLNVEGKNPTSGNAALNGFDWILLIEGQEMLRGNQPNRMTIAPNGGVSLIPMSLQLDLYKALNGKSKDAIIKFGTALAGSNNEPAKVKLKLKPYFIVSGQNLAWPNYIEISKDFKALK